MKEKGINSWVYVENEKIGFVRNWYVQQYTDKNEAVCIGSLFPISIDISKIFEISFLGFVPAKKFSESPLLKNFDLLHDKFPSVNYLKLYDREEKNILLEAKQTVPLPCPKIIKNNDHIEIDCKFLVTN